jgi:single-strand DNA-binding protein
LRIATSENWKDKDGQRQERTEWHSVAIFSDGLVKVCESYLRKGSKVFVEGQLQTRKWQDQSGNDRYSTEIVLRGFNGTLTMLDGRSEGGGGGGQGSYGGAGSGGGGQSGGGDWGGGDGSSGPGGGGSPGSGGHQDLADDLDDDIPF